MKKYDLLIVGAGMVGLSLALAIRKLSQLTVAIVDTSVISELSDEPELRVSAINAASQALFENLEVWQQILETRAQPYHFMQVWDEAGFGKLAFADQKLNHQQLGFIIENKVIRNALWHKAQADHGISFYTEEKISNIGMGESEVFVAFENKHSQQMPITAKLIVGADGANSWLRSQIQSSLIFRDYDHHAIVATVECSQGHQDTAWQVFLKDGPLAFLPLQGNNQQGEAGKLASIVWSTSPEQAKALVALNSEDFSKKITAAADGKLGKITLKSERLTYPLMMRLAQNFVQDRAILIGDAAHTIHPLAGQGVNLGLKDAAAFAEIIAKQQTEQGKTNVDISPKALNEFARWRKNDAVEMIAMMESIKQLFAVKPKPLQILRGVGMSLLNGLPPVKKQLIKQALGYQSHMPALMQIAAKRL